MNVGVGGFGLGVQYLPSASARARAAEASKIKALVDEAKGIVSRRNECFDRFASEWVSELGWAFEFARLRRFWFLPRFPRLKHFVLPSTDELKNGRRI